MALLSPRWRKVLRDLWVSKTRTVLVVLSIAVGVFAIGMIAGTQAILSRELNESYARSHPASAILQVEPFDDELVDSVRRTPGVAAASAKRVVSTRFKTGPRDWHSLQLNVIEDNRRAPIAALRPERGTWPPSKGEVLMERASLAEAKLEVGSVIPVETPDGKLRDLRVAGTVYDVGSPPPAFAYGVAAGYINEDTLEWMGWPKESQQLQFAVATDGSNKEHIRQVADRVELTVKRSGRKVFRTEIPEPGRHPADSGVKPLLLILGVLGYLVLLLSVVLVINTISAILSQQVRHIGIMKTIGARRHQVVGMYMVAVLIFGALSLAVAVPLGVLGARLLSESLASLLNADIIDPSIPNDVLGLQVVLAAVVPLLAALFPVLGGARITVREAISEYGLVKAQGKMGMLDRLLERLVFLSRPVLLSLRNTFRRKGRLALTLGTLTLGGAIFIGIFSVRASLLTTLDEALAYWKYDIGLSFNRPYRVERISSEVRQVPGVVAAESWGYGQGHRVRPDGTKSKTMFTIAPPAGTRLLQPTLLQGRWLLPADENAIVINSLILKDEPDLRIGDDLKLKLGDDKTEYTFRIVGLVRGVMTGPIAYINYPYYARMTHNTGMAGVAQVLTERHDLAYQLELGKVLEERLGTAGMRVTQVESVAQLRVTIESLFNIIVALLSVMAVLLAVVGGLGLMGTMSINVLERTREIGVMRAIGASDGAIRRIVIVEGVLIGTLSWAMGVVVAFPLSMALSEAVGQSLLESPLTYTFSLPGAGIWLAVVVVIASLASLLPARNASRISVRDALAYD